MNKEERIYPSMVIRSQAEAMKLLEKENKRFQNNRNELKEWLESKLDSPKDFWSVLSIKDILEKMQEIESRK